MLKIIFRHGRHIFTAKDTDFEFLVGAWRGHGTGFFEVREGLVDDGIGVDDLGDFGVGFLEGDEGGGGGEVDAVDLDLLHSLVCVLSP